MIVVVVAAIASACGGRSWRRALLRSGAVNVGEAISDAMSDGITVVEASFSPDSESLLVHALSLSSGTSTIWIYRIEDGSLIQNGLKPGWTLATAAFLADGNRIIIATERPEPPTYRLYETPVGSSEWANMTDLIPTTHVKTVKIAPSPDGETYAVLSVAEGHGDVVVSRGGDILHETQVYPGFVKIVGWDAKGEVLYLESDMPLDLGLDMEAREKNVAWDESMREGGKTRLFALESGEGTVSVVEPQSVPDPTVSPDGKWKVHSIPMEEGVSGLFLTSH